MDIQRLKDTILFRGMTEEEITLALAGLRAEERQYKKGAGLLHAGTATDRMGLVQSGSILIESNDMWGNRTILSHTGQGQVFAVAYAFLENEPLPVDVTANEDCSVLFLRLTGIRAAENSSAVWAVKLLTNLMTVLSKRSLALSHRSSHTALKTVRGRVMSYLNAVSLQKQCREFDIPFDRQQLADYLNLDRSALSKELGRLQRDGIIETKKSHFRLL